MIEDFEVIETYYKGKKWENHKYKFKLNSNTFYSEFFVSEQEHELGIITDYYKNPENKSDSLSMSKELENEIKSFILKQKDIRLRHVVSPYKFW